MKARRQSNYDFTFIAWVALVVGLGLLLLASASAVVSFQKFGTSYYYLQRQFLYGLIPGAVLFYLFSRLDYHLVVKWSLLALGVCLVALIAVLIPSVGVSSGGASRW